MSSAQQDDTHNNPNRPSVSPITVDRRPPQLNEALSRSQCGCACVTRPGKIDGALEHGGDLSPEVGSPTGSMLDGNYSDRSVSGDEVSGDEGAAEHKIEIGDFGLVSVRVIFSALAKHSRCTCHGGILPDGDDYPFTGANSLASSGVLSTASRLVEPSGSVRTMSPASVTMSTSVLSLVSTAGSDAYMEMGAHLDNNLALPAPRVSLFHASPIWLAHERAYCFNMEVGISSVPHYPPELSIEDAAASADHSAYDMW